MLIDDVAFCIMLWGRRLIKSPPGLSRSYSMGIAARSAQMPMDPNDLINAVRCDANADAKF